MPKLLGMTQSAYDPASRVRLIQFLPYLRAAGWEVDHRPNRPDRQWTSPLSVRAARGVHYRVGRLAMKWNRWRDVLDADRYDVVFVNRDLAGAGLLHEKKLLRKNRNVVFDFDDAIFLGPNEPAVRWMCEHAAWVTPGNTYLADYVRRHTDRVTVIPTVIDTDRYLSGRDPAARRDGTVRVGWSGSDFSIRATLFPYLELLARLQKRVSFQFVIVSNSKPVLPVKEFSWTFSPWSAETEGELGEVMDIGLMPLVDSEFQRGKCGLKLLQYMAAGLPTVASPVGVNAQITQHGRTGFLASSQSEWEEAITTLVQSPVLRGSMGTAGRQVCVEQYSIRRWLPVLLEVFQRVHDGSA